MSNWKDRIKTIFPYFYNNKNRYNDIKYDSEEAISYASPSQRMEKAIGLMDYFLNGKYVCIDVCGGLGSASINIARKSKKINKLLIFEIDKNRYNIMKHNINLYIEDDNEGKYPWNKSIETMNENFITFFKNNKLTDIVYFIAFPWGGTSYKNDKDINNSYSIINDDGKSMNILEFLNLIKDTYKLIIVEAPIKMNLIENNFINYCSLVIKTTKYIFINNS